MARIKSVCVYCGSSNDVKPGYLRLATELGRTLAQKGLRLVYGGGGVGLMGACARAAHGDGGDVLGIMPKFLLHKERIFESVEHRIVDDMHTRKQMMFDESDAFIVLPGGMILRRPPSGPHHRHHRPDGYRGAPGCGRDLWRAGYSR